MSDVFLVERRIKLNTERWAEAIIANVYIVAMGLDVEWWVRAWFLIAAVVMLGMSIWSSRDLSRFEKARATMSDPGDYFRQREGM